MISMEKNSLIDRITELGERVVTGTTIEIVEVQLRGAGKARLLRIYVDKPGGITHGDCQLVSERLGKLLDDEEAIPDDGYTLEVSSPGVERKLTRPRDFERVLGQKVNLAFHQPVAGQARLEGRLKEVGAGVIGVESPAGDLLHIPLDQVRKATLKFEW